MTDRTTITLTKDTKRQLDEQRPEDSPWDEFISSELVNSPGDPSAESAVGSQDGTANSGPTADEFKRIRGRADEFKATINDLLEAYQLQDDERLKEEMDRAEDLVRGP